MESLMRSTIIVLALCCFVGCKHEGAISPQKEVIPNPVSPKFKLAGSWIPDAEILLPVGSNEPVSIRQTDDGVFAVTFPDADGLDVEVRTTPLRPRKGYVIAEAHASANDTSWLRFIGIIKCSDDKLSVAWIESENLARLMHEEGHSAVIERSAFGTKVFAESDDLLDCITKHANELVGKPATFTRQPK